MFYVWWSAPKSIIIIFYPHTLFFLGFFLYRSQNIIINIGQKTMDLLGKGMMGMDNYTYQWIVLGFWSYLLLHGSRQRWIDDLRSVCCVV
jgi:hypothetical protein